MPKSKSKAEAALDRKEQALEGVKPESKAAPWLRLGGIAATTGLGAVLGGRALVSRAARRTVPVPSDPQTLRRAGRLIGGAVGLYGGGTAALIHGSPVRKSVAKRQLVDAKERKDKQLAAAGMTEEEARHGPKGSLTERSTAGRNIAVGTGLGAALGAGLGYRMGRRKAAPLIRGARQFIRNTDDAARRGVLDPMEAMHNRMMGDKVRIGAKYMAPVSAVQGGIVGATAGLMGGAVAGNARQTKRQRARQAVDAYDIEREEALALRRDPGVKKASPIDAAARKVRKHWPKVRNVMTSGPVGGAAVGGVTGAALGASTADENKGFRDAAIGGAALGAVGALIGHKYKRVPMKRGKGVRVISDFEAERLAEKGFIEPRLPPSRRLKI